MRSRVALLAAVVVVAGCSSARHSGTPPGPSSSSAYMPPDGQDAAITASHIPGCTGVQSEGVGQGGNGAPTSAASCTLDGHLVIVDSFAPGGGTIDAGLLSKGKQIYYASGIGGWLAFLGDPGETASTTTLQMQLTNDAGGLLHQATSGTAPTPAPLDAQQQISAIVAKDLRGAVEHVSGTAS